MSSAVNKMDNTIALAAAAVVLLIIIILVSVLRKQFESSEFEIMSIFKYNLKSIQNFQKVEMWRSLCRLLLPQLPLAEYEELSPSEID